MINAAVIKTYCEENQIPYLENENLSKHTSFRIGGPAALFCRPTAVQQIIGLLQLCRKQKIRSYILGHGSNVLFADTPFDGVIIHIAENFAQISVAQNCITAQAGASLQKLCNAALTEELTGLEFAYGIPGCVGGAVYMNAGAYGGEIKDVLQSVTFANENGEVRTLPAAELMLGYRTSIFNRKPWCVLQAEFALQNGSAQSIRAAMDDFMARRKDKQPLDMPSAGSTFKRPEGAFAGALIEQCGLKGMCVGGAAVSTKHCGFVVNTGGATCADVIALTDEIVRIVKEKTGFTLEKEIRVIR